MKRWKLLMLDGSFMEVNTKYMTQVYGFLVFHNTKGDFNNALKGVRVEHVVTWEVVSVGP